MKKLILTLSLILCGYTISNASILSKQFSELAVGSNPVSILEDPQTGMIHIFCAGIDANDNNRFDEGEDEKPSWWTYNPTGSSSEANKVKEFNNYFVSPFKPSIAAGIDQYYFGLAFKCDTVDGEFAGNGRLLVVDIKTFATVFDLEQSNSELLFTNNNTEYILNITRVNGNDLLSMTDVVTQEMQEVVLNGDATDYTLIDLDGDGKDELAILIDNKTLAFYKFGTSIELVTQTDLTLLADYTGEFGHLYSKGGTIFTTFGNKGSLLKVSLMLSGNVFLDISDYSSLLELSYPSSFYPLDNNIQVITNSINNLIVRNGSSIIPEMHRTSNSTDFVYANETTVYITSGKNILIYDYTNKLNRDINYIVDGFVGYQPLDILASNDNYYTINLGIDFNFDGNIDETIGDEKPSINKLKLSDDGYLFAENSKYIDFGFPINFPLNTNISSDGDIVLPSGNTAYFYNADDNVVYDSLDAEMYVSCAFRVLDYLVLGQRDYAENKSYVRIKKGDFIDVKTEVGANVIDVIVYQNASGFGVVSLSEGNFGAPDAKINLLKLSTMGFGDNKEIAVGTGGNSIVANADQTKAAIVMNGSHEIHILNLLTGEIDKTFSTGTTGYGGPRDAKFSGDKLYVTTYSNQIILFDATTGKRLNAIVIDGKSEGLALTDKYLLVANSNYDNYQPSNRIFAYEIDKISNVEETVAAQQTIRVYPNPVANEFNIVSDDLAGTNDIAIINGQGKIVATYSGSSNGAIALNADALGLVSGNYTAIINGTRAVRFVVIK